MPTAVAAVIGQENSVASDFFCDDFLDGELEDLTCMIQDQESPQENLESNSVADLDADDDLIPQIVLNHYFTHQMLVLRLVLPDSFVVHQNNQPPPRQ